jgi:hypothetical protein
MGAALHVVIANRDPTNIECLLRSRGLRVDMVALASARAWDFFDTAVVHQAQAFGSSVGTPARLPHSVPGLSGNAAWVPAQGELFATNGTQSAGGSYVTVNVTRKSRRGPSSLSVATEVARAVLAVAPRGPNPGAPPS